MNPLPPPWAHYARHKEERAQANVYAKEVRQRTACGKRSASIVAWLALPWEGLCVPMGSDAHVSCADDCEDGAALYDVVRFMWWWSDEGCAIREPARLWWFTVGHHLPGATRPDDFRVAYP
jgi:hypothetical protein